MVTTRTIAALMLGFSFYARHSPVVAQEQTSSISDPAALTLLLRSAEKGDATSQSTVGIVYAKGLGVPQNFSEAIKWFRKAAEQGHSDAQFNLGLFYENGQGVPRDYQTAAEWYRKAAGQNLAPAEYNLGILYQTGKGFSPSYAEALKWFNKAAEHGLVIAQRKIGAYYSSTGNQTEGHKWLLRAAEQGDAVSQYMVGADYERGSTSHNYVSGQGAGLTQDFIEAHKWYNLSAAGGDLEAGRKRDDLAKKMTPAQIAEAQRLARDWKPKPETNY